MKKVLITIVALLLPLMASGGVKKTIHVATAGTLPTLISNEDKYQIEELTLTGDLNGTDIACIRRMAGAPVNYFDNTGGALKIKESDAIYGNLSVLNISGAKIVSGGDYYFNFYYNFVTDEEWDAESIDRFYTSNNAISAYMFYMCKLTKVSLPTNVTSIEGDAFSGCSGLTSITIPSSVTSIGWNAFTNCGSLTSIKVESGNRYYDSRNNCNAIISTSSNELILGCLNTIIPNDVTSIGGSAFKNCSGLTSITIPNSVASIGSGAFYGTGWYNNQPDGLVYAGKVAYCYKGSMPDNTSITIKDGTLGVAGSAFHNCSGLTSITIPNSVTSMGDDAFYGCSGLTSVTIPNSVTSIGERAFENCSGLTSITIPNSVASIGSGAFYGTGWYNNQPDGLVYVGKVAYKYKGTMPDNTSITIKDGTLGVAGSAFYNCSGLTSITIPNSVTSIGRCAFQDCRSLTSITIPNSVTSIGYSAFSGCSGLTSVTIGEGVTSIEMWAFYGCTRLTSITIPNSVTSIGYSAFSGCSGLTSIIVEFGNTKYDSRDNCNGIIETETNALVHGCNNTTIPNSVTSIRSYAFKSCNGLTSVTIPNRVTSIGYSAFSGCSGLTSVTIGEGVTSIEMWAFYGCTRLTSITIPNSVTSIGESAFYGCTGLTSVTISNSVTSISCHAFSGCTGLTSVTIPNSVTNIGERAFEGCKGLTSVTIPNSVKSIGGSAFQYCTSLTFIISLNKTPQALGFDPFYSVDKTNCVVWVPSGSAKTYKDTDVWKDFQNIRELNIGDVNLNSEVNKDDLDALVDFVMDKNPEGFYGSLADLNGDDNVNVADVVKLVTILNIQDGLSMDWQTSYSNQVVSSLTCTLNNDGDKTIQLTKCEFYCNQSLVGSSNFKTTLASGGSKSVSFNNLTSYSAKAGFSVVWHYTYNGESYTYRCDLTE